jgi:hypothetical protein
MDRDSTRRLPKTDPQSVMPAALRHSMSLQHCQADGMDGRCILDDPHATIAALCSSAPPRTICRNLITRSRATLTQALHRVDRMLIPLPLLPDRRQIAGNGLDQLWGSPQKNGRSGALAQPPKRLCRHWMLATTKRATKIYNIDTLPFDEADSQRAKLKIFTKRLSIFRHDRIPRVLFPALLRVGRKSIAPAPIARAPCAPVLTTCLVPLSSTSNPRNLRLSSRSWHSSCPQNGNWTSTPAPFSPSLAGSGWPVRRVEVTASRLYTSCIRSTVSRESNLYSASISAHFTYIHHLSRTRPPPSTSNERHIPSTPVSLSISSAPIKANSSGSHLTTSQSPPPPRSPSSTATGPGSPRPISTTPSSASAGGCLIHGIGRNILERGRSSVMFSLR